MCHDLTPGNVTLDMAIVISTVLGQRLLICFFCDAQLDLKLNRWANITRHSSKIVAITGGVLHCLGGVCDNK